jgi:hypothetical protein
MGAPAPTLVFLLRQWLAAHKTVVYAVAAAVLVAYLFYRPPPPAGERECAGRRGKGKSKPRVTLSTPGVLLDNFSAAGLSKLADGALEALRALTEHTELYLITSGIDSDTDESTLRAALETAGVLALPGFDARRILVCSTTAGRSAMCRQIEPALHIDTASDIALLLAPHLQHVALVSPSPIPEPFGRDNGRDNILLSSSLADLVARHSHVWSGEPRARQA